MLVQFSILDLPTSVQTRREINLESMHITWSLRYEVIDNIKIMLICLSVVSTLLWLSLSVVNDNNFRHTMEFFSLPNCCSLKRQRKKKKPWSPFLLFLSPSVSFKSFYILFIQTHTVVEVVVVMVADKGAQAKMKLSSVSSLLPRPSSALDASVLPVVNVCFS